MKRKKILIVEHDDFLREILGNLLHKNGYYIISDFCINNGFKLSKNKKIDSIIIGTSCKEYEGKKTIHYIKKQFGNVNIFVINNTEDVIDFIDKDKQIKTSELSIKQILRNVYI